MTKQDRQDLRREADQTPRRQTEQSATKSQDRRAPWEKRGTKSGAEYTPRR